MDKKALRAWADPLIEALRAMEKGVEQTPGDASMLNEVERLARELPIPDYQALADDMAGDMSAAAAGAVEGWLAGIQAAEDAVRSFAADNPGFEPVLAAIEKIAGKTPIASALRTADWERVPLALRERGQFSAGVESIKVMASIQDQILHRVRHEREVLANGKERYVSRDSFLRDIRKIAMEEGLDTGQGNVLTNIAAPKRIGLIYDMQNQLAAGYARWKLDNDEDALAILPAWRLGESTARAPRDDWWERWQDAGNAVGWEGASQRDLVALKTSPIWARLSRFGTPWPPFDFGSTRQLEDVWRDEAERLGLVRPEERIAPTAAKDFNDELEASASEITAPGAQWMKDHFGDQVQWDRNRQTFRWQGNMIAELYDRATTDPQFKGKVDLGMATDKAVRLARQAGVPMDLQGMKMYLTADDIRKAHNTHGVGNERDAAQSPLTRLHFEIAPHVWRDPDRVSFGTLTQKPKAGTVEMSKQMLGRQWVIGWNRDPKSNVLFVNTIYDWRE